MKREFEWPFLASFRKRPVRREHHSMSLILTCVGLGVGLYIVKDWMRLRRAPRQARRVVDQINNPFFEVERPKEAVHHH
jgi:hypothetical protein